MEASFPMASIFYVDIIILTRLAVKIPTNGVMPSASRRMASRMITELWLHFLLYSCF
jgi:hypothetical protein